MSANMYTDHTNTCSTHILTDRVTKSKVIALCTKDGIQASNTEVQRSFDKQTYGCHNDEDSHLCNQDGQQEVPVHLQNDCISIRYEMKQ